MTIMEFIAEMRRQGGDDSEIISILRIRDREIAQGIFRDYSDYLRVDTPPVSPGVGEKLREHIYQTSLANRKQHVTVYTRNEPGEGAIPIMMQWRRGPKFPIRTIHCHRKRNQFIITSMGVVRRLYRDGDDWYLDKIGPGASFWHDYFINMPRLHSNCDKKDQRNSGR